MYPWALFKKRNIKKQMKHKQEKKFRLNKTTPTTNKHESPNGPNRPKNFCVTIRDFPYTQWLPHWPHHFHNPPSTPFDLCCKTTEKRVWTRRPSIKSATDLKKSLLAWSLFASPCTSCTVFKISHKHEWICQQVINASRVWVLGDFFFYFLSCKLYKNAKQRDVAPFNVNPL